MLSGMSRAATKSEFDMSLRTDRLQQLREARGWTKREFAQRCGFSELQAYRYESAVNDPSTDNLKTIASVLEVSSDYLLGLSDDPAIQVRDLKLDEAEHIMIETYRREGWRGVVRLGVEKIP